MPPRRILFLALFGTLVACPPPALARPITVTVRNQPVAATAIVENGHVLLPMRVTFETLNSNVFYDRDSGTISARNILHALRLKVGNATAIIDGRTVQMETPPRLINDRVYVPLAFAAQAMGAIIRYDAATNVIAVNGSSPAAHDRGAAVAPPPQRAVQQTTPVVQVLYPVVITANGAAATSAIDARRATALPGAPFGFDSFGFPGGVVNGGLTIVGPPAASGFSGTCTPAFGVASCPFTFAPFNFGTGRSIYLPTTTTGGLFLTGSPLNPLGQYPSGPIVNPVVLPLRPLR